MKTISTLFVCLILGTVSVNASETAPCQQVQEKRCVRVNTLSGVEFMSVEPAITNAQLSLEGTVFNETCGHSWKMFQPGESLIQMDLDLNKNEDRPYTLELNHVSRDDVAFAKISVMVNGQIVAQAFEPKNEDFVRDRFDIAKFLQDGHNEIIVSLDANTESEYSIQSMKVLSF